MNTSKDLVIPWNSFPEGKIVQHDNLWAVRTGIVVNRPKRAKKYEDSYMALHMLSGESNAVLGYTIRAKKEFDHVFEQNTFMSFLCDVGNHTNPKYLYKDPKVHLLRFNNTKKPSYWFLVRYRP